MRGLAALALTLVLTVAGCGGSSTLSEHALRKQAETVQSAAAERALLADDVARDRTTEPFARVHSGELADQAKSAGDSLRTAAVPRTLEADRRRTAATAVRVERALDRLHGAPTDHELARSLTRELERDAETAGRLAG